MCQGLTRTVMAFGGLVRVPPSTGRAADERGHRLGLAALRKQSVAHALEATLPVALVTAAELTRARGPHGGVPATWVLVGTQGLLALPVWLPTGHAHLQPCWCLKLSVPPSSRPPSTTARGPRRSPCSVPIHSVTQKPLLLHRSGSGLASGLAEVRPAPSLLCVLQSWLSASCCHIAFRPHWFTGGAADCRSF